jgi:hypothetical protein
MEHATKNKGALFIILAGVLLWSLYDTCNNVAYVVIRSGDSVVQYCVAPNHDNCSLPSISIYCHNVLRFEVLLFMLVLQ